MPLDKSDKGVKARLKDIIATYITEEGARTLESDLATLRPVDRLTIIERLMKYCIPTLGSLKMEGVNDGEPIKIKVEYVEDKPSDIDEDETDKDYSESA